MIVNIPVLLLLQIADAGIDILKEFFLIPGQCDMIPLKQTR